MTTIETERVHLRCYYCFHWEKGRRTKEQIADWLRVHRSAGLGPYDGDLELASTCPHPCSPPVPGTPTPTYKGPTDATLARNLDLCRSMENGTPLTCGLPTGHDGPHSFDSPVPGTTTPTGQT